MREALELIEGVQQLGLFAGPVIANGVEPEPTLVGSPGDADTLLGALAELPDADGVSGRALVSCVRAAVSRAALQDGFRKQLADALGNHAIELPYLADGAPIERLARAFETGMPA